MTRQLEYLYSNIVWVPMEVLKRIKPIGVSWSTRGTYEQIEKLKFYVTKIATKDYSLKLCFNQQWSYSNPLDYSYLLQCVSFMRYNNQTFSQHKDLCVQEGEDTEKHGETLRSCRQMTIYSLDMMQRYCCQSRSSSLLTSR